MSLSVGIDIAKDKLDIYHEGRYEQIENNASAIKKHFKAYSTGCRFLMEATGKHHRLAHRLLSEMGFEVMIINPFQSKNFAKALNLLCKTDKVDAKMLALFCERMDFKPTACPSENERKIQELSRHLDDLKQT